MTLDQLLIVAIEPGRETYAPRMPATAKATAVATGPGSRRLRCAFAAAAAIYVVGVWLDAAGAPLSHVVPRPVLYFMQVGGLFPNALDVTTEYRAEAYFCEEQRWRELDVRPSFPLRANDKENRFDRAMFFYRRSAPVMKALDDYIVASNNLAGLPPVGGVLLLSLRIPVPPPGEVVTRYERRPIADYPTSFRKYWYRTSLDDVHARCDEEAHRRESATR